ncbi:MAG: hypothetical protein OEM62_00820 [Acidobacteriota bacterium]|nr:hypothetical protein [Acidobacteriota bacterium]
MFELDTPHTTELLVAGPRQQLQELAGLYLGDRAIGYGIGDPRATGSMQPALDRDASVGARENDG